MTPNHPIPATRVEIESPKPPPPPRPELYAIAWPHYEEHLKSWLWCVMSETNPPRSDVAKMPGAVLFKLPADPQPAHPAPSDWRQACKVVRRATGEWDVVAPSGHYLAGGFPDTCEWHKWDGTEEEAHEFGIFTTEEIARAALSIAPPPPGVSQ